MIKKQIDAEEAKKRADETLKNFTEDEQVNGQLGEFKVLGNIEFPLCENEYVGYDERNKDFYLYHPDSKINRRTHLVSIPMELKGLAIDDDGNQYFDATVDGIHHFFTFEEIRDAIKNHAVTGSHLEKIIEFLTLYQLDKPNITKSLKIHPNVIFIDEDDTIHTDIPHEINLSATLTTLYKLWQISTSRDNFTINFAYFLIAPLSFYFRKQQKLFPYLINSGFPQSGKTSYQLLFANQGYMQDFLKSHFTRNDLKTYYTLMRSRADSILPITLEDVELNWIKAQAQMLKGSAGTINGGSRGYFNRVQKFLSKSQLAFDTNDTVDVEVAQLDRFIVCNFSAESVFRVNIARFDSLKDELVPGFMFSIFDAVFAGEKLEEITKQIYDVKNRNSLKINLIKWVVNQINSIMPESMKFRMPDFKVLSNDANSTDWLSEIYATGKYICEQLSSGEDKNHPYELNKAQIEFFEDLKNKTSALFLTAGGYLLLQKHLNLPHKNINELLNNSTSLAFSIKSTSHRFDGEKTHPMKCVIITPKISEDLVDPELQKLLDAKKTLEDLKVPTTDIDGKIKEYRDAHSNNTGNGTIDNTGTNESDEPSEDNQVPREFSNDELRNYRDYISYLLEYSSPSNEIGNIERNVASKFGISSTDFNNTVLPHIIESKLAVINGKHLEKIANDYAWIYRRTENPIDINALRSEFAELYIKISQTFTVNSWKYLALRVPKNEDFESIKSWNKFMMKTEPASEKAYNALSKGDQQ